MHQAQPGGVPGMQKGGRNNRSVQRSNLVDDAGPESGDPGQLQRQRIQRLKQQLWRRLRELQQQQR